MTFFVINITLTTSAQVLILNEEVNIEFVGLKAEFTTFSMKKQITFEVQDDESALKMRTMRLPEPIDETYFPRTPAYYNHGFYLTDLKIRTFKVEKRSSSGRWVEKTVQQNIIWNEALIDTERGYGKYPSFTYKLPKIHPGDIIRITYEWSAPLEGNAMQLTSNCFYHHGKYPKKAHTMTLEYPKEFSLDLFYENGDTPSDIKETPDGTMMEFWTYSNLPASLNEDGAHPYDELPYTRFLLRNFTGYLWRGTWSQPLIWPMSYLAIMERNWEMYSEEMSIRVGNTSKNFVELRKYVEAFDDTSSFEKFNSIHRDILENFNFNNDSTYYQGFRHLEPSLGEKLNEKELLDRFRFRSYSAILHTLSLDYSFAYLCDRSHAKADINFLKPLYSDDFLFAVLDEQDRVNFIYPKSGRCGYYLNEFPFYFEKTEVILLSYSNPMDIESGDLEPQVPETRIMQTPTSNSSENARTINAIATLTEDSLKFEGQITLNGQFSTMTRALYLCNETATGVNPAYNKYLWEIHEDVKLKASDAETTTALFPFTTKVKTAFSIPLSISDSGTVILPIGAWFHHIYDMEFDSTNRSMNYHPDFQQSDRFSIQIKLPENATVSELPASIYSSNNYGKYQFQVSQTGKKAISILSTYSITKDMVPQLEIKKVTEINAALDAARSVSLSIKLE